MNNCMFHMADGRSFTDYRPNDDLNNMVKVENNLQNSHEYRKFLTNNAMAFMERNVSNVKEVCNLSINEDWRMKEVNNVVCSKDNGCKRSPFTKDGLGTGRIYSDEKQCY